MSLSSSTPYFFLLFLFVCFSIVLSNDTLIPSLSPSPHQLQLLCIVAIVRPSLRKAVSRLSRPRPRPSRPKRCRRPKPKRPSRPSRSRRPARSRRRRRSRTQRRRRATPSRLCTSVCGALNAQRSLFLSAQSSGAHFCFCVRSEPVGDAKRSSGVHSGPAVPSKSLIEKRCEICGKQGGSGCVAGSAMCDCAHARASPQRQMQ